MSRGRISIALMVMLCCSLLLMSCGGGGGGAAGVPPPPPCNNCISVSTPNPFGDVELTKYSGQDLSITNNGTENLLIGQIASSDPLAPPFSIFSDDCSNKTLPPKQICRVNVRFTPTGLGLGSDVFNIPSNDPRAVTVNVSGNGIPLSVPTPTPPPNINVTKDALFGDVLVNSTSTQTLTVTNFGTLNLDIGPIGGNDPLAAPFGIVNDGCSNTTLAANRNCTFGVRFSPTALGSASDTFNIPSNDPTKPSFTVAVTGKGVTPPTPPPPTPPPPSIGVSNTNIAFGNVVWNNVADQTITLQNTGAAGSGNLAIGQIAQVNPLLPPFSIVNDNCSNKSLASGQTCPFDVRFAPTTQGADLSDFFDIPSNDPLKPSVNMTVTGNGRALRVSINDVKTDTCPNLVLSVSVEDKDAVPVTGLTLGNVGLSENGVSKAITSFLPTLDSTPLSVVLTLDISGTLTNQFSFVKSASSGFVGQLRPGDEAAVISFSQQVTLKQAFTTDIAALQAAIDNLALAGDRTLLYDALFASIDNAATVAVPTHNKAIVLISDGIDQGPPADPTNGSVKTLAEVIAHAQATGVTIFTIGIGNVNADVMSQLAAETGGQYFLAPDPSQLASIYEVIRRIIQGDYSLTYVSTLHGPILLDVFVQDGAGCPTAITCRQGEVSRTVQGCP